MSQTNAGDIRIEPVDVTWTINQQDCITPVADVAESLDGTHFLLGSDFYVWMDIALAADPAPAGRTGIAVVVAADSSAATIATAMTAAIDADGAFEASEANGSVFATRLDEAEHAGALDVDTGFTILTTQEGGSLDLGLLQGNVENSFEEQLLEITAHQTGTTILTALRQGVSATITLTMQETTIAKLRDLFSKTGGGAVTPAGGTELYGWGTSRQGDNVIPQTRRLNLHPVNADADLSRDLTFWKAYPLLNNLVYSGEEAKTLEVEWRLFLDDSKPAEVSLFAFGDSSQLFPA